MKEFLRRKFLGILPFSTLRALLAKKVTSSHVSQLSEILGKYELLDDMLLETYQERHGLLLARAYMRYFRETYEIFGEESFSWDMWKVTGTDMRTVPISSLLVRIDPREFLETLLRLSDSIRLKLYRLPLDRTEREKLEDEMSKFLLKKAGLSGDTRYQPRSRRIFRLTLMHFCAYRKTYDEADVTVFNYFGKPDGVHERNTVISVNLSLKELKSVLEQVKPSLFP
jgi:hypothetical protein